VEDVSEVLAEIDAASERLVATVSRLGDDDLREPSRLPGWSRGHVLAHLVRNADAVWNILEWARTGVEHPQYPSNEARNAGIEASSGRPADELRTELRISVERLALQASTLPEAAWEATVRARGGWGHPAWYTLYRRWREVEAHHADLSFGYSYADWSPAYVRWELSDTLASLRLDGGLAAGRVRATDLGVDERLGEGPQVSGTGRELLGWLTGRGDGEGLTAEALPTPPTWPLAAPAWRDVTGP
jgi:maleylpyruvate isomerase